MGGKKSRPQKTSTCLFSLCFLVGIFEDFSAVSYYILESSTLGQGSAGIDFKSLIGLDWSIIYHHYLCIIKSKSVTASYGWWRCTGLPGETID